MRKTSDTRGNSFWDVFEFLPGQVNISRTLPGQKRGFHLHNHKTDYWVVVEGRQLVVLKHPDQERFEVKVLDAGDFLEIKPKVWHGYQCISDTPSTMVYYETAKSGVGRDDDLEMSLDAFSGWQEK